MILPVGTRVWIAVTDCPDIGRTGWTSDGTVIDHIPCSPCWQNVIASREHLPTFDGITDDLAAAGAACREPSGYTVLADDGERRTTIHPGCGLTLAVPIAGSAAA